MSFQEIILGQFIIIGFWTVLAGLLLDDRRIYRMMGPLLSVLVLMSLVVLAS